MPSLLFYLPTPLSSVFFASVCSRGRCSAPHRFPLHRSPLPCLAARLPELLARPGSAPLCPAADQAKVLQHRLGTFRLARLEASAQDSPDGAVGSALNGRLDELQRLGTEELQRLAVARLSCDRYSVLHALLGALPHEAAVTTNCDECYDAASADAGVDVNVLPYDARTSQRWLLKLHGDVAHPEDIVLTYSSAAPYGADRQALSGMVQALLITKHMLFVGFSLRDEAFHQAK
eukprot:6195832-Pleurochrysis_carterae.AAC.4